MRRLLIPATIAAAAMVLAACGGGNGGDESSAEPGTRGDAETTLSTAQIDGRAVLVDADGFALYRAQQEAGGEVLCTGACVSIWEPLTIQGNEPTGDVGDGTLGVVERPDGTTQVTFNGNPLYRFAPDQPGEIGGDGVTDAVGGQEFTWQVITVGDEPSAPSTTDGSGGIPGY